MFSCSTVTLFSGYQACMSFANFEVEGYRLAGRRENSTPVRFFKENDFWEIKISLSSLL